MTQSDPTSEAVAKLLAGRFIERRDAKAVQMRDTKGVDMYVPHREWDKAARKPGPDIPVRLRDLIDHVEYRASFGHYVVGHDNTCRIFAFDIDIIKEDYLMPMFEAEPRVVPDPRAVWLDGSDRDAQLDMGTQMRMMSMELALRVKEILSVPVTVHFSGCKGVHVTGLIEPGTPAAEAREMSELVLNSLNHFELFKGQNFWHSKEYPALYLETFPKQPEIKNEAGYGNLLRLPLGMNIKSGKKSFFVNLDLPVTKWGKDDPLTVLTLGSVR